MMTGAEAISRRPDIILLEIQNHNRPKTYHRKIWSPKNLGSSLVIWTIGV
jgi:hypothetical protein